MSDTFWCPSCGKTSCRTSECLSLDVKPLPSFADHGLAMATYARVEASPGYESLAGVLDDALEQAQGGKGIERHGGGGERFEDQQIVQLGEWMGNTTAFCIGQACKKSIESTRLPDDRARHELLGAIVYLVGAVLTIDRRAEKP